MTQVNGLEEVYFTVGNIVTIIGGIISLAAAYFALKYGQKSNEKEIQNTKEIHKQETNSLKESIINAKRGRNAIKQELKEMIKELDEHNRARIDKTQEEFKNFVDKTNAEFKEINQSLNKIIGLLEQKK